MGIEVMGSRKGISPLIATALLLVLAFALAALIGPWAFNAARTLSSQKANESTRTVQCQNAGYDFDSSWNSTGIGFNVSGTSDTITAKIVNTGLQKLYNFTFVVTVNQTTSIVLNEYQANATTQRTQANGLRPGERLLLGAYVTDDITGTVLRVRVTNEACPSVYAERSV